MKSSSINAPPNAFYPNMNVGMPQPQQPQGALNPSLVSSASSPLPQSGLGPDAFAQQQPYSQAGLTHRSPGQPNDYAAYSNDPNAAFLQNLPGMPNSLISNPMALAGVQFTQNLVQERLGVAKSWLALDSVKYYFAVSNRYVMHKIRLLLFPFIHRSWKREHLDPTQVVSGGNFVDPAVQYQLSAPFGSVFRTPADDVNAPDLYIPTMAFVTYVLLMSLAVAISGAPFHPDVIGMNASSTLVSLVLETLALRLVFYFISPSYAPWMLDLVAYSAYKYVAAVVIIGIHLCLSWWSLSMGAVAWFGICSAFFMMRTIKRALTPGEEGPALSMSSEPSTLQAIKYVCLVVGLLQILIVYFLIRQALI